MGMSRQRMGATRIGVVGATGTAGRAAIAALTSTDLWGDHSDRPILRVGSRRTESAEKLAASINGDAHGFTAEPGVVDIDDEASLVEFCRDCTVVLSTAGPSFIFGDRVGRAALAVGAHYVDVSGYDPVHENLSALDPAGKGLTVILSAGIYPGFSTLLPRWLATRVPGRPVRLRSYVGGMEPAPEGSAADLVLSLREGAVWGSSGSGMAAWRDGRRAEGALRAVADTELPFFPDRVALQPFLSREAERLAIDLGLVDLDWYNVFAGAQTKVAFTRLRTGLPVDDQELIDATRQVMRASELDLAGREPYYVMVHEMEEFTRDGVVTHTGVLRTRDTYAVTGMIGALGVRTALAGELPAGAHYAGDALDPAAAVELVRRLPVVSALEVVAAQPAAEEFELGAL